MNEEEEIKKTMSVLGKRSWASRTPEQKLAHIDNMVAARKKKRLSTEDTKEPLQD